MKTKEILKEWRSFLKESAYKKFTEKDVKNKLKITYSPCCEECSKFLKMSIGQEKSGILTGCDGNDIKVKDDIVNTIFVNKKMIPQCCVKLNNEQS